MERIEQESKSIKFSIKRHGTEVARASLFLISNDLHNKHYGLMEDVFVEPEFRGQGLGTQLSNSIVEEAKKLGCYKLIATSRHTREKVHSLYLKLGFIDHGKEFRMNFE
ncbi:GNAT family N-acetyltransferase [Candidatus Woesearchaeota archaeon]|nr:GNAT family N-acetyltransferase [Candidatus Woesearchaeota archaeon]